MSWSAIFLSLGLTFSAGIVAASPDNPPSHDLFSHTLTCADCSSFDTLDGLKDATMFFHNIVFSNAIDGSEFAITITGGPASFGPVLVSAWIRAQDTAGNIVRVGLMTYDPVLAAQIWGGVPQIVTITVVKGGIATTIDLLVDKGEFYTIVDVITQTYSTTGLATEIHSNGALSAFYAVPTLDIWSGPAGSYNGTVTITKEPSNPNPVSPAPEPQPSDPPPDPCANGGCIPGVPN